MLFTIVTTKQWLKRFHFKGLPFANLKNFFFIVKSSHLQIYSLKTWFKNKWHIQAIYRFKSFLIQLILTWRIYPFICSCTYFSHAASRWSVVLQSNKFLLASKSLLYNRCDSQLLSKLRIEMVLCSLLCFICAFTSYSNDSNHGIIT